MKKAYIAIVICLAMAVYAYVLNQPMPEKPQSEDILRGIIKANGGCANNNTKQRK